MSFHYTAGITSRMTPLMVFRNFLNYHQLVCYDEDLEYYEALRDAWYEFYKPPNIVELISFSQSGLSQEEFSSLWVETDDNFESLKYEIWNYQKSLPDKKDHRVFSLIDPQSLKQKQTQDSYTFTEERMFSLLSRTTEEKDFDFYYTLLESAGFIDLGDPRDVNSSSEFIEKIYVLLSSQGYFGSACTWSQLADDWNIPNSTIINIYAKRQFPDFKLKKRKEILDELLE